VSDTSTETETVTLTIDGREVTVPKGTNVIEAAKALGQEISAFCYHPGLEVVAVCRQCLVSIEGSPKLIPGCQAVATEGMVVKTEDEDSTLARKQMLEFTLVNHPIDCPICDKAGECSLQRFYFDHDNADSRVDIPKVKKPKVVDLGPHIVLDAERCILCTRCIRVCDEVAGQHQLDMKNRGNHEEITTAPGEQLDNPYSINTVDVCPVGALTSKDFRFTMRAWELYATESICNGCATGCNMEVHHKGERAWRLVPRENAEVNKFWMCDDGRFTYHDLRKSRTAVPQVSGLPANWEKATRAAALVLKSAVEADKSKVGVVFSAQQDNETNYVLKKLAVDIWGLENLYLGGKPHDREWSDDILKNADRNPNTSGARAIVGAGLKDAKALESALSSGAVTTLLCLGSDLDIDGAALAKAQLVTLAVHELGPVVMASGVLLPITAWAEADGTVTNKDGRVQRMRAALAPTGQAKPGWECLSRLAKACDAAVAFDSAQAVFDEMVSKVDAFSGSEWGKRRRTIQLRFANTRG